MSVPAGAPLPPATTPRARLVTAVASAVDAVPGVRRSGGSGVEVATQFAGGRVVGVKFGLDRVDIHVVVERLPLDGVVDQIHSRVSEVLLAADDRRTVSVVVDDLDVDRLPRRKRR